MKNLGCLYAFAGLLGLICLVIIYSQAAPLLTWRPTPATVLGGGVVRHSTSSGTSNYEPQVTYHYTVNGAEYTSHRVEPLMESASERWAQSLVDRYPTGAVVIAYYDPRKPSDAYIYRHFSVIPLIVISAMAAMATLIVGLAKRTQAMSAAVLAGGDVPVVSAR